MTLALPALTLRARTLVLALLLALTASLVAPVADQLQGITWTDHRPAAIDRGIHADGGGAGAAEAKVVVQAEPGRAAEAAAAVSAAGGTVGAGLPLIEGFAAVVPTGTLDELAESDAIRAVSADRKVQFEEFSYDATATASNFVKSSGATAGWSQGRLGQGVGVAIIDTGVSEMPDFAGRLVHGPDLSGEGKVVDSYGHGTVMAGLIGGSGADSATLSTGKHTGAAPKATLVAVKAAGRNGAADVSTMLQGMHWVASYLSLIHI